MTWPDHGITPDHPTAAWPQPPPGDAGAPVEGEQAEAGRPPPGEGAQRRAAARAFRPRRTVPATVTALLLALAALVTLIGAVAAATGANMRTVPWTSFADFAAGPVDDPAHLATASAALVLGLLLLGLALVPGRTRVVPLASDDPRTVTGMTEGGLRRHLATVAAGVDGVSRARVKLRRRVVHVRAVTPLRDPGGLPGEITEAVGERLDEMRPLKPMRVRVHISQKGK
ncbi:alkaline shock response membrane anchor protein AmaP [Sphaerisporangium album]|uniref:Alkaline shock response membrane anchor protein AmaP n=1 Tax=Sphaerisporangium album TaxID=509200 RepID=A0A367F4R1_9ACTN|nr:DUF6286 domain-containing protein [Sphaerisporangium album]RCG25343.1 alkaline shock response membrane anchor protein AmaP [Sphaerisporangium album]